MFKSLSKLRLVISVISGGGGGGGGITFMNIIEVTTDHLVSASDDVVVGTGTLNVTLPPVTNGLKSLTIKSTAGSAVTVIADGSELIEGFPTRALGSEESITIVPTNNNDWAII